MDYQCPSCRQIVRLPDDSPGKSTLCPKCGAIISVPGGFAPARFGPAPAASDNPYSAPQSGYAPPALAVSGGMIRNQPADAGQVISHAWKVWAENLGLLLGVTLVMLVVSIAFMVVSWRVEAMLLEQGHDRATVMLGGLLVSLVGTFPQVYLGVGETLMILKMLRGQEASFGDLFSGGPRFWPALGVYILVTLLCAAGLMLCIVPGIVLMLMFWPVNNLVIDSKTGVLESFSVASSITEGNRGTTFVLFVASLGMILLGFLACGVGILFAAPLVAVVWVTAYLMMSGQLSPLGDQASYGVT